jgi:uncharacterized protein (TIGR03067 family)
MPSDLDKLQGVWNIVSLEVDGQELPANALGDSRITIKGTSFTSTGMTIKYGGKVEIDPDEKPKTFDLIFSSGPEKGNHNRGIYKLNGDTWIICLATRGDTRPTKFATTPGSGFALETLQRENGVRKSPKVSSRSTKSSRPNEKLAPTELRSGPMTELEGEWEMLSAIFNGDAMDQSAVNWCRRVTRGNITSVTAGSQVFVNASFSLDHSQNPKGIDYMNLAGPHKGKSQAGIFELTADSLRICMSAPGKPRPKEFSSKRGDGRSDTTWRLLKK